MAEIATRVYNHNWKIDPIIRSVLDTDFYKLLMAQTIFRRHRDVSVTFGVQNRTRRVRLSDLPDIATLRVDNVSAGGGGGGGAGRAGSSGLPTNLSHRPFQRWKVFHAAYTATPNRMMTT